MVLIEAIGNSATYRVITGDDFYSSPKEGEHVIVNPGGHLAIQKEFILVSSKTGSWKIKTDEQSKIISMINLDNV